MKQYVLQHKKDTNTFVERLPFGNQVEVIRFTNDIEQAEKFYQNGGTLRIYRSMSKGDFANLKDELKNYKLVEVETKTIIKGQEIEQLELILGG